MNKTSLVAVAALAIVLAACAKKPYPPESAMEPSAAAPAPPTASAPAPAIASTPAAAPTPAASPASSTSSTWTTTYPYGSSDSASTQQAAVQPAPQSAAADPAPQGEVLARATDTGESVTVYSSEDEDGERTPIAPFVSGWAKQGVSQEQHRSDIEACYRFAWSQVEHDMRIESDVAAARDDADKGLGITALTQRMNLYDHKERRSELINDCMETKGYAQR